MKILVQFALDPYATVSNMQNFTTCTGIKRTDYYQQAFREDNDSGSTELFDLYFKQKNRSYAPSIEIDFHKQNRRYFINLPFLSKPK